MKFNSVTHITARMELLDLILGEYLGGGVDRDVFVCAYDPSLVVKVTVGEFDFQNVAEWTLWMHADKEMSKWLAPCVKISKGGAVLIQKRCEKIPSSLMPTKVPECIAGDFHRNNVGWLDGRPVAMDYGRHTAIRMTANAKRMATPAYLEDGSDIRRSW